MNKRVLNLIFLLAFLFLNATAYSQAVTMTAATGGLAGAAQISGTNDIAVLGVQLNKATGGGNTVTSITIGMTPTPVGKFTNARLYESADATFSGVGSETLVASGTITATDISFTGAPLSSFDGATALADDEFFFIVVDVDPTAATAATTTPSLASTGVIVSTGTNTGTTITGATYTLTAPQTTIANLSAGLAASPLIAGTTGQGVFGFSLTSTGTQTVTALNIQVTSTPIGKWGSYSLITSTDNDFSTTGDNSAAIGGLTITPSATEIAITGLSQTITTSATNYFLVVNVDPSVTTATGAVTPSVAAANATASTGTFTGTATGTAYSFAPILTIANLSTGLAGSPLISGTSNQGVFGFSLSSSASQTVTVINVQLTSTPASKWSNYRLITSTDASYATTGDNSAPIGGLTFTPSASQVAITGLTQVITSGTNYFLVVDVDPAVTGATAAVQPSLVAGNITITTGGGVAAGSATGTNYSFGTATATFTEITAGTAPVIGSNVLSAGSTLQVLTGFSVTSNGTQQITDIGFNYSGLTSQFDDEMLYRSTTPGVIGSEVQADASPDGNFGSLTETINGTPVYFYLVVNVANNVNSATASVTTAPTQANITVSSGNKSPFSISRVFTFATSQNSNIILQGGTTDNIDYRNNRTANPLTSGTSASLATFRIQDGGGVADADNASTTLTALQIQLTNFAMVRRIALFDGGSIIAGTQQDVSGGTITFTGLSLAATDATGFKDFTVRATFQNTVTDNALIDVTILSATASATGSGFAAANAGGASSTTAASADANKIEVIASALAFVANPPNTAINTPFALSIQAKDAQNNIDLDYNSQVELSTTGAASGILSDNGVNAPGVNQPLAPVTLSNGIYDWTLLRLSQSGTYTLEASDDDYDDDFSNPTATVIISSSASGITQATTTPATICYGTAFFPLTDIVITETDPAGISGTPATAYTFSIALPSGFVFDQTVTNPGVGLQATGADITVATGPQYSYPSANVVQFSYTFNGTATLTTLSIRGLRVGRPHLGNTMPGNVKPPALTGLDITRSGGSAIIAGVAAGVDLGTLNVSTPPTISEFTVDELPGDVTVDPGTTSFNINANSVKLAPSISTPPGSNSFSGNGVTFVSPDYRFNPNSLSPGAYDISYTNTDGSGCQAAFIKTFTVFVSGINGLDPAYCNNADTETGLTVDQTFVDQRMSYYNTIYGTTNGTWKFDYFVYYDPNNGGFTPITTPSNDAFDPKLSQYQTIVQSFGGEMPVGFAVCNTYPGSPALPIGTPIIPCSCYPNPPGSCSPSPTYNFGVYDTYQWVTINAAPSPTFTLPRTTFCLDDPAVVLTGTPPNSDNTLKDFFFATETVSPFNASPTGTVSVSVPPTSKVWSFNPGSLGVGTANIYYTYENPATGCTGTSAATTVTVNARPDPVVPGAITSAGGIAPETCQGAPIGTFTATPLTSPNRYTWYSNIALTTVVGTGNSFAPPNPPVDPNVPTPVGSPHTFYVTQTINGCESNKQLVSPPPAQPVTVTIKASPAAPVPNFNDSPDREFCVGITIDASKLVVPGSSVRWFDVNNALTHTGSNPSTSDLNIVTPTVSDTLYSFDVTQTVSLCESPRTPVRVRIKSLPSLSVSAGTTDPLKICTEGGHDGGSGTLITFSGSDENGPVTTGSWTVPSGPALTPGALIPGGGTALLNTPTLIPDSYTLRFTHTNSALCSNSIDIPLTVLPKLIPSLTPLDSCFESFVHLNNTSKIQTGPGTPVAATPADVISTSWSFNDGNQLPPGSGPVGSAANNGGRTTGTYFSPEHNFANLGSKSVTYTMTTTYCSYAGTEQLTIHPKPQINFTWGNPCFDSLTMRSSTSFETNEMTDPSIPISQYNWNFNVGGNLNFTGSPGGGNPIVNYTDVGTDSVELIVLTEAQCRDTLQKIVHILPTYKAITDSTGYDQSFNAGNDFWIAGGTRSSWTLGNTIAGTEASDGAAWATGLAGPNNDGERSWVMSGCFNFSNAVKPVVSLDAWSDTPFGVDGVVFQYNEDGVIEDEASWEVLGVVGSGINWYDGSGISNSPGNQSSNDYGWTGIYPGWKKAIYKLDEVKPATPTSPDSLIVFRIAFGGGNRQQSGFAFDNLFIGERTRVVLLENFTNTSEAANTTAATTNHNNKYSNPALSGDVALGEIVKIQYHTPFPGTDLLNQQNDQMNNSRAAFYGITTVPTARVDGGYENGNFVTWFDDYNDDRVLTPSVIKLNATADKVGTDVKINITLTNTTSQTLPLNGVHLFTVIVQKEILKAGNEELFGSTNNTEFAYVAKQMLPTAAGIALSGSLNGGAEYAGLPEITWSHPNGGDAIVIFVQRIDGEDKNVYQAHIIESPPSPDVITNTEDPEYAKHINLYPNPANHEVNIELPAAVNKPTPIALYDAFGRIVYQSTFEAGEKTKAVSTTPFANGIYMLQLILPGGSKVTRKVMVKH